MMRSVESKKYALVTGGSRGIGRAICLELAKNGINLALCYAGNEAAAQETVDACKAFGVETMAIKCDVSQSEQVSQCIHVVLEAFGRIDILVNNAGMTQDGLLMSMKEADFEQVLAVNLKGTFLCMKAVSRQMLKQKYGRVINLSSIVALRGNAGQSNYAASKAGILGLTKSAAKELASRNITVNAIAPGFIDTDMTAAMPEKTRAAILSTIPMGKMGAAEDIAKAVAFLASDDASYITGQVLCVDGGMAM